MAGGSAAGVTVSDRAPPSVIVHESTEPRVLSDPRVDALPSSRTLYDVPGTGKCRGLES